MGREKGEGRRVTTTLVLTCPSTHSTVYALSAIAAWELQQAGMCVFDIV